MSTHKLSINRNNGQISKCVPIKSVLPPATLGLRFLSIYTTIWYGINANYSTSITTRGQHFSTITSQLDTFPLIYCAPGGQSGSQCPADWPCYKFWQLKLKSLPPARTIPLPYRSA